MAEQVVGEAPGMMMDKMNMYFYWGKEVIVLFKSAHVTTSGGYAAAIIVVFALAFFYEGLSYVRYSLSSRSPVLKTSLLETETETEQDLQVDIPRRVVITALYFVSITVAYFLMLIAMTFNGGLFIALVLGLVVGYAAFGFRTPAAKGYENVKINTDEAGKGETCCTKK